MWVGGLTIFAWFVVGLAMAGIILGAVYAMSLFFPWSLLGIAVGALVSWAWIHVTGGVGR
jgi:hypothetical protein